MEDVSQHFRQFATTLEGAIARYEYGDLMDERQVTRLQKKQVEKLAALEESFRLAVIRHSNGPKVYEAFIRHIVDVRRNILAARPYFRERSGIFTKSVAPALKKGAWRSLFRFHVNHRFVRFAMQTATWAPGSLARKYAKRIDAARHELVVMNLPLVISRARIFWSKTQESHLSFMDIIQVGVEGLIAAVDKYSGTYSEVWPSVAIGRMTGNFIEAYSEKMLHFYPTDQRKVYRANKFLAKHARGGYSLDDLVSSVNRKVPVRQRTTPDEIMALMAASSMVSSDTKAPGTEPEAPDNIARYEAPEESRPDVQVEETEAMARMKSLAGELPLRDKKLLRMKGVDVALVSR